ncbi:FAD:protein FMN transferase [Lapidilactobacillus bayanensis]|uniref:FAD:protein FMN transferase n=1 Tax=Lapidilactobacillus bayanensis TaxID=2485998 RepID=UPI000F7A265A|nr:FAD:protein FMN transferase [Lapidilactobacillus bayanensis]
MPRAKRQFYFLNHVVNIMIESANADAILNETGARLKIYAQRFDQRNGSQIATINRQSGSKAVSVEPQLYELIKLGKHHSQASTSNLNIALEPLTRLWQIGYPDARIPAAEEIHDWLPLTDPASIILDDDQHAVFLSQTGMQLNLSALVKGYVTDLLISYFNSVKVHAALIDFAGSLTVLGPSRQVDQQWRLPIGATETEQPCAFVTLTNKSLTTRQPYRRALIKNNQVYSYLFNPQTGWPIDTDITNLTIISDRAIDGEIWSLRLLNQTTATILQEINRRPNIDVVLINDAHEVFYSDGLVDLITVN